MVRGASDFDSPCHVDYRTNDNLSVSAVCETYCINTCCEPLRPQCNPISFNKSNNVTPSPPKPQWAVLFCSPVKVPFTISPVHGSFVGRLHNQIWTMWLWKTDTIYSFISFTWYHFNHHNYQVEHVICWKFILSLVLHNTTSVIIIIEWNVVFVEKIFLLTSSMGHAGISEWQHVNTTENEMSPTGIFISNWFVVC